MQICLFHQKFELQVLLSELKSMLVCLPLGQYVEELVMKMLQFYLFMYELVQLHLGLKEERELLLLGSEKVHENLHPLTHQVWIS